MPVKWREIDDSKLFDAGEEQPGSQREYDRRIEIARRQNERAKALHERQMEAADHQIEASKAIARNAKWIRASAFAVIVGTIVAVVSLVISLL